MSKSESNGRHLERSSNTGERGFVLVACVVADSAALYAAQQLDGTTAGITAANSAVAANPNAWNFGTTAFTGTITEYSADGSTKLADFRQNHGCSRC